MPDTRQDRDSARAVERVMASKINGTPQKEEVPKKEGPATPPDSPLLDLSGAAVKKLIKQAKKRGYVTHEQINALLSLEEVKSEQIEDILTMFSEIGVNVVETEDGEQEEENKPAEEAEEEDDSGGDLVESKPKPMATTADNAEPSGRTDDPVRMYLRDMGSVELLSREGEIAIAKRFEAGREGMIAGLCESPLTFQAIIIWRDELNDGKILLRDIIDLQATYAGPDAKNNTAMASGIGLPGVPGEAPPAATPYKAPTGRPDGQTAEGEQQPSEGDFDDDDMENSLSLTAIEAKLKPQVVETFDKIADTYKRLRRLQDQDIQFQLKSQTLSPAQERKYKKLKNEIIAEVTSLQLDRARIDALVEQLYDINKRLVGFEGRLLRLAESYRIKREDFLAHY